MKHLLLLVLWLMALPAAAQTSVFINELHYDNAGTDAGEAVEIAGPAGTSLDGWQLVLYNGNGGLPYATTPLSGALPDQEDGFGTLFVAYPPNGMQNGAPDGLALVDPAGDVVQFLSYEGTFAATEGPANGQTSTDIGVAEGSGTPVGSSLQLTGTGTTFEDFAWSGPSDASFGAVNADQRFGEGDNGNGDDPLVCGDPATFIHEVQGDGATSPLAGSVVEIEGIVVGDFQTNDQPDDGELRGFYVQEEPTDTDDTPATSEGLFVFEGSSPTTDVATGDVVRVRGEVAEFETSGGASSLTQLTSISALDVCGTAPVPSPVDVTLPVDAPEVFERYEGMRVRFPQTLVIAEYFNYDRFGQIVLALPLAFEGQELERPYQPTSYVEPGPAAEALEDALELRTITLDDGLATQNPFPLRHPNGAPFGPDNLFRGGDAVENAVGTLDDTFGEYRIQPTNGAGYTQTNPRPEQPEDVGGSLRVASFNLLNFFTTLDDGQDVCGANQDLECRGADTQEEFERQRTKLLDALLEIDADVYGLVEVESTPGADPLGNLASGLNERTSPGTFATLDTPPLGTDAIKVGFLYKPGVVTPVGGFATLTEPASVFIGPGTNRVPLAQTFEENATGERFTAVVNHFKSKGCGGATGLNEDQGDGQGCFNARRVEAAEALVDWLATDPTGSGDPDVLILGDLNAYDEEDPIDVLRQAGYTDLIEQAEGEFSYSFVFDGQFGYLDYALASASLLPRVTGATEWHINADEPDVWDYNLDFNDPSYFQPNAYRTSDHDPVIVGLDLVATTTSESFELRRGVNRVSSTVQPANPQLNAVLDALLPRDLVVMVERGGRGVFLPRAGLDTIGAWEACQPYVLVLRRPAVLELAGQPVDCSNADRSRASDQAVAEAGREATLLVESAALQTGDEVAVYAPDGTPLGRATAAAGHTAVILDVSPEHAATGAALRIVREAAEETTLPVRSVTDLLTDKPLPQEARLAPGMAWLVRADATPTAFSLEANAPNPFEHTTEIAFALPEASEVRLTIYDALGREVARLAEGRFEAGTYRIPFEAGALPSGVYVYRLRAGSYQASRTMLLVK